MNEDKKKKKAPKKVKHYLTGEDIDMLNEEKAESYLSDAYKDSYDAA